MDLLPSYEYASVVEHNLSEVRNFLGIKAFQLFHRFLGKGPREGGGGTKKEEGKGGRERRKGEEEGRGGGRGRKEGGGRGKKGEEEEGRGREGCQFTMNKYSDITQHTQVPVELASWHLQLLAAL